MDWIEYCKYYRDYEFSLNKTILNYFSRILFRNFPEQLPNDIKDRFSNNLIHLQKYIVAEGPKNHDESLIGDLNRIDTTKRFDEIAIEQFTLVMIAIKSGQKPESIYDGVKFEQTLFNQELVMQVAFFEAFLSDSFNILLKTYSDDLIIPQHHELIHKNVVIPLIEKEILTFSKISIKDKLHKLKEKLNFTIPLTSKDISFIDKMELCRHLIIHSNGRTNDRFKAKCDDVSLIDGDYLKITKGMINKLSDQFHLLALAVFTSVARKVYRKSDEEIRANTFDHQLLWAVNDGSHLLNKMDNRE